MVGANKAHVPGPRARGAQKKKNGRFGGGGVGKNKNAIAPTKTRIRDLERLLNHRDDLPATVKQEKEMELESLRLDLERAYRDKRRSKMIGKYHMVRFFDRKKADRELKKAKKILELSTDPTERKHLEQRVNDAQIDLNYTQYYPLLRVYIALYPSNKEWAEAKAVGSEDSPTAPGTMGDREMWLRVKMATLEGPAALQSLREESENTSRSDALTRRKAHVDPGASTTGNMSKKRTQADKKTSRDHSTSQAQLESEESDDGGFFEKPPS